MAEQSFHHYSLKHRAIAWISQNLFRANVYTVGHGLNKGLKRKGGLGFLPEFLAEPSFPTKPRKILFDPAGICADDASYTRARSWAGVTAAVFGGSA